MAAVEPFAQDTIDVLIPVYNGAAWLRESIASIQRQTHRDLRIHVVDDGSTDETPGILATLAAADDRIRVHRQPNAGIVGALNAGLAHCTARWVARHDADDLARPERFERQLAWMQAHPDCVAVGGVARHIDGGGTATGTFTILSPPGQADFRRIPAREPYLMHPFMLARRSALVAIGGYRQASHAEDSDLYWRLREKGTLHNLPDVLGDYRMHGLSISGASIVNGRLMAVGSQRAALSARRREERRPDLAFDSRRPALAAADTSLRAIVEAGMHGVDGAERPWLELAVSAKLLELAGYLPYEIDAADCVYIHAACARHLHTLHALDRRGLQSQRVRAAQRLAGQRRWRDALRLLPWRGLPEFAARLAWTTALPATLRQRLHAARRPPPEFKDVDPTASP